MNEIKRNLVLASLTGMLGDANIAFIEGRRSKL